MSGVAILLAFAILAGLMIARKLPALLAVPAMALVTAAFAGAGPGGVALVVTDGTSRLAAVIATLIAGAWLSRVVLAAGIAETIVAYAAEFGGDRPMVLALVLCCAVAALFTAVTGLGAIIMVGTIVLPVMMTVGVARATAATLFLLAFGTGYVLNIAQWKFYRDVFGVAPEEITRYGIVLFIIQAAMLLVYAGVRTRADRGAAFLALAGEGPRKRAGVPALVTPLLPLILHAGLHVEPVVAFGIAAIYGALVTAPRRAVQTLVAAIVRGVEDVAPALVLMLGIGMLLVAAKQPLVAAAVTPLVAAVAPRGPLAYILVFGLLSPLALYRGPLNPFGVGIGVYAILASLHTVPAIALVAAVMAVVQVQNVCDPTNTQNVWVANFTGVAVERITRLTLPFQIAVATIGVIAAIVAGAALFGRAPFAVASAASAAETKTGIGAPPAAARVIGVWADGAGTASIADGLAREIGRGWSGYRSIAVSADPAGSTCDVKPYAAVLHVTATAGDLGVALTDCAGWSVEEWHAPVPPGAGPLDVLVRIRTWEREHPQLARNVLERGIAFDPQRPQPTYFFVLFKPSDGYLRALVRTGGPAWHAGLRTGDVIDKIDGREWWMYGTYQSQLRAYDGKPHTFDVERGGVRGPAGHVELGAPYAGTG